MTRFIQALLTGMLFALVFDFFIFLGIFQNYIRANNIDVYYNILFADHQNIFLFIALSILLGLLLIYTQSVKFQFFLVMILLLASFAPLIPSLGESLAKKMFMQKNITLHVANQTYNGEIYYNGRTALYFNDTSTATKILKFKKEDLTDETYN